MATELKITCLLDSIQCLFRHLNQNENHDYMLSCGQNFCEWRLACIGFKKGINHRTNKPCRDPEGKIKFMRLKAQALLEAANRQEAANELPRQSAGEGLNV